MSRKPSVRIAALAASALLAASGAAARPMNIVWFAGGGGSSEGQAMAGFAPDYALNHNGTALAMHQVNHPDCVHLCDDAFARYPVTLEPGRAIRSAWFSPDCTHFSVARGSAPKSPRIRGLAWCVIPWAKLRQPDVIFIENVKEFTTWGPLDDQGRPIKRRAGETFRRFVRRLEQSGYVVEWRVLNCADYGAPTTRRRLFIMARSLASIAAEGLVHDSANGVSAIVWPERTHAPRKQAAALGLKPYRSAGSIIDWSLPCPSIFLTSVEAKAEGLNVKRPLVAATQRRIFKGIERYVVGSAEPYLVQLTHQGDRRPLDPGEPMPTVTGANRGEVAAVVPTIVPILNATWSPDRVDDAAEPARTITAARGGEFAVSETMLKAAFTTAQYGERDGQAPRCGTVAEPYPTVVQGGNGGRLVVASIGRQFGRSVGSDAADPVGTTTAVSGGKTQLIAASLGRQFGSNVGGVDAANPMPTVMGEGGGGKTNLIAASLTTYYGTGVGSDVREATRTVTGEDRHGVVAAWLEQANTGMVGHAANDALSTTTGRGTQQRLIETRLAAIGAPADSRRRQVLRFLWDHAGEPTEAEWADPLATARGRLRFGLVIFDGAAFEIADIGMRMLTVRELFNAQGFRSDYIIDRDIYGGRITATAATLMVGNSVPPDVACALTAANLNTPPSSERLAA